MYSLTAAAGDRWNLTSEAETKAFTLFQDYVQCLERLAELEAEHLTRLLSPECRESHTDGFWRDSLTSAGESLAEEEQRKVDELAPEGYELVIRYYQLYTSACVRTVDAIFEFLDGMGNLASVQTALSALKAHNEARGLYLQSLNFPTRL